MTKKAKNEKSIAGYLPDSWQLEKETEFYLKIVHKQFDVKRTIGRYEIQKERKEGKDEFTKSDIAILL